MKLGLTRKRDALARLINYLGEEDKDIPRVDPATISEAEIIEQLSELPMSIPEPLFEKNIPPKVEEGMFANDFSISSGDAQEDNNNVGMINRSIANNKIVEAEEEERDRQEFTSILGDIEFQNPVAPTPPNTGQVTSQQVADLFPNDPTTIAAARRRETQRG